jgi:hypothetical protein
MRKTLSLHNMAHRYGAGLLLSAYFVLGIALVPITLLPEMSSVQKVTFRECHTSCHKGNDGRNVCTQQCSVRETPTKTTKTLMYDKRGGTGTHGSTGPTVPPKPGGTQGHKY